MFITSSARLFHAGGFTRGELSLIASAAVVGLSVGYLLVSDFTLMPASFRAKGDPIGEVIAFENSVKRRPADVPLWTAATKNQQLYQKDQIYTDKGSRARVSFGKAGNIDVEENALVVIEKREDQTSLDVQKGSIIARVTDETKHGIQVNVSGRRAVLSGTNLTAVIGKDSRGETKVSVLEGQGQLSINGAAVQLKQNQEASIPNTSAAPTLTQLPDIKLSSMGNGQALIEPNGLVKLSWDAKRASPTVYRVQFAKELSFVNPVVDNQVTSNDVSISPQGEGRYYWRVGIYEKKTASWTYSAPAVQSVSFTAKPNLVFPRLNQTIENEAAGEDIKVKTYLDWESQPAASAYNVQLALDPSFRELILNKRTTNPPLQTGPLLPGMFYWRVQALYNQDTASQWSTRGNFSVSKVSETADTPLPVVAASDNTVADQVTPKPVPPVPVATPSAGLAVSPDTAKPAQPKIDAPTVTASATSLSRTAEDVPVTLTWSSVKQAQQYLVQVANDSRFLTNLSENTLAHTEYKTLLGAGLFYARVLAVTADDRKGDWSNAVKISVKQATMLKPATLIEPSEGAVFNYRVLQPDVKFVWDEVPGAKSYKIEIASDRDFKKKLKSAKSNKTNVVFALTPGSYYWHVAADNPTDTKEIYSPPSYLTVVQKGDVPVLRMPTERMTVDFDQNEDRILQFLWDNPPDVQDVYVVIGRDQTFEKLVGRFPASTNSLSLQVKSDGPYYWMVEGRDKKEHAALRSKIGNFNVVTTPVRTSKSSQEAMRVEFAYSPTTENYSHKDNKGISDTYKASYSNSYQVSLKGWLTPGFGIDTEYKKRSAKLKVKGGVDETGYSASSELTDAAGVLRYRVALFEKRFPIDVGLRVGYSFNQVHTFYSELASKERHARRNDTHHLITGVETLVPIGANLSLEVNVNYLHKLRAAPIELNTSKFYTTNVDFLYQFLKHGLLGFGLFFQTMEATYADREFNSKGSFKTTTYGTQYSVGWIF